MTKLERLGLEVIAFTLLGSRIQAATLVVLLEAKGRMCGWETLAGAREWRRPASDEKATRRAIMVRVCLLRQSMDDLGLGGLIVSAERDTVMCPGNGYALPEPGRSAVMARLMAEVEG